MKRSYISDMNGSRLACDSVVAVAVIELPSKAVQGAVKRGIVAMTAAGGYPLAECYAHEAAVEQERWTRVVFGGSERQVEHAKAGVVQ